MENTELTQDEQEKAYEEEYNKAFFGDGNESKEEIEDEPIEKEEIQDDPAENVQDENEQEEGAKQEDDSDDSDDSNPDDSEHVDLDTSDDAQPDSDALETITWKGKEVKVTKDEMTALAQKGFDYTSKTQELAQMKKEIAILEAFDKKELEALKRAKSGDKEALAFLIQQTGTDTVDLLDVEPANIDLHNDQSEVLLSPQVAPLVDELMSNPDEYASMQDAITKLPKAVTDAMQQSPEWFNAVYTEVRSGNLDKALPQVQVRLSQMSGVERTYFETNPQAFADLYADVTNSGVNQAPQVAPKAPSKKPNMAEVGLKRNGGNDRRSEVKKDAFTDDKAYQATLARMRRTIG